MTRTFALMADQLKRGEQERKMHIHFLESLARIDRAIRTADNVKQMLWNVAEATRDIFNSDRVWLLYPCDPEAPNCRVPVEVTLPEYPGACDFKLDVPMKPGADEICRALLASDGPVAFGPGGEMPLYKEVTEQFGVQSQLIMGIYPKTGKPWMFGMHQCSHARVWTSEERQLFNEISRRIGDGLSSMIFPNNLRSSEECFSLPGLIHEVLSVTTVKVHGKGLTLYYEDGTCIPGMVRGDARKLRQVR